MQTNFIFASVLIPRLIHAKARRSKSAEHLRWDRKRRERRVVRLQRLPRGGIYRQPLLAEHRLELRPHLLRARHRLDLGKPRVRREALLYRREVLGVVRRELDAPADLETLPKRVQEERPEQAMRVMLALRPRIGEEHVDAPRVVRRQKVVERVQRLEPQHLRVVDSAAPALSVEKPDALEHALDAEKVAVGVLLRAGGEELALAAADLYLERARQVEFEGARYVRHPEDVVPALSANRRRAHDRSAIVTTFGFTFGSTIGFKDDLSNA